jgi:hypothetical protein
LELEITESVLMHSLERTQGILATLRASGVRIAIDDFGTGYSSLSYLANFPVQTVKVDRSFVRQIDSGQGTALLAGAIIAMAHSLGQGGGRGRGDARLAQAPGRPGPELLQASAASRCRSNKCPGPSNAWKPCRECSRTCPRSPATARRSSRSTERSGPEGPQHAGFGATGAAVARSGGQTTSNSLPCHWPTAHRGVLAAVESDRPEMVLNSFFAIDRAAILWSSPARPPGICSPASNDHWPNGRAPC